jgi:hypothetical protein
MEVEIIDFYASNAPSVPDWFKHSMSPEPTLPIPMCENGRFSKLEQDTIKNFWIDECDEWHPEHESAIPEDLKNKVAEFLKEWDEKYKAIAAWRYRDKIERITQWRFFYANEMIKKRMSS